jgi:hypothetical protein
VNGVPLAAGDRLVQLSVKRGIIEQMPLDSKADDVVVELHLGAHQRVVTLELWKAPEQRGRKTTDWHWRAVVESRL